MDKCSCQKTKNFRALRSLLGNMMRIRNETRGIAYSDGCPGDEVSYRRTRQVDELTRQVRLCDPGGPAGGCHPLDFGTERKGWFVQHALLEARQAARGRRVYRKPRQHRES